MPEISKHYLKGLNNNNKEKHSSYILKRREEFKKGKYYTKKEKLGSHKTKESKHIVKVKKLYGIEFTEKQIEKATGVSIPNFSKEK